MAGLGLRQLQEQVLAQGISFGGSQRRIERGAVELVAQVVSISFDICIHGNVLWRMMDLKLLQSLNLLQGLKLRVHAYGDDGHGAAIGVVAGGLDPLVVETQVSPRTCGEVIVCLYDLLGSALRQSAIADEDAET